MNGEQHVHASAEEVALLAQAAIPLARRYAIERLRREVEGKGLREKVTIPVNTAGLILNAINALTVEVRALPDREKAALALGERLLTWAAGGSPDSLADIEEEAHWALGDLLAEGTT